jgi:hypothetical protein
MTADQEWPSTDSIEVAALIHAFDQTVWPHIRPILIDEIKTSGTAVRLVDDCPAVRHFDETRPERVLPFFVDEHVIDSIFIFKWIRHFVLH